MSYRSPGCLDRMTKRGGLGENLYRVRLSIYHTRYESDRNFFSVVVHGLVSYRNMIGKHNDEVRRRIAVCAKNVA